LTVETTGKLREHTGYVLNQCMSQNSF